MRIGRRDSKWNQPRWETAAPPKLKRVLGLWDLVYYGVILTSPIAVVPMFGEAQVLSQGHAVITLLAAMVAMTATAVSFGRMATVYPSAGSVYTYVSRGFNPQIGFVVGWAMFLEYLFQPLQNSLYAALTIQRLVPHIPFALLSARGGWLHDLLCWFGIRTTARANQILLAFMSIVMVGFSWARPSGTSSRTSIGRDWFRPSRSTIPERSACARLRQVRRWPLLPISASTGSAFWRKKSRIRSATSCWRPSWFVCSRDCSRPSRFTWRSESGPTIAPWSIRKLPSWT